MRESPKCECSKEPEHTGFTISAAQLRTLAGWLLALLLVEVALLIALLRPAHADEPFTLDTPSCYLGAIDYRYVLADGADAIVWWCATPSGLERNYRAGEVGGIREFLFRIGGAGKDLYAADKQIFIRAPSDAEDAVARRIEDAGEPRCYAQGTGKSQQVYTRLPGSAEPTLGPAQVDASGKVVYFETGTRVVCWSWITAGAKRYCSVAGDTDTKGRTLDPGSFALCRIELAPDEGWPQ